MREAFAAKEFRLVCSVPNHLQKWLIFVFF
jgi:hypothetical protein